MNAIVPSTPLPDNQFHQFEFAGISVRYLQAEDGEAYFVASDVCNALALSNVSQAVSRLKDSEKRDIISNDSVGRPNKLVLITESGLYRLIFRSDKEQAEAFRTKVFEEVLPQIRKTGSYIEKPLSPAEMLVAQAQAMLQHERRLEALEQRQEELSAQIGAQNEYFTVMAYCRIKGIPSPNMNTAIHYGKLCSTYSRKAGISIGKITDQRRGYVNTYRVDVLEAILLPPMLGAQS